MAGSVVSIVARCRVRLVGKKNTDFATLNMGTQADIKIMKQLTCQIEAMWDAEAKVWVATSEDVPGLVTEAEGLAVLTGKLREIVPELLRLNEVLVAQEAYSMTLDSGLDSLILTHSLLIFHYRDSRQFLSTTSAC